MRTTYPTNLILLHLFILITLDEGAIYEVLARLGVLTVELLNVQVFCVVFGCKDEGKAILLNVANYLPKDRA